MCVKRVIKTYINFLEAEYVAFKYKRDSMVPVYGTSMWIHIELTLF